MVPLGSMTRLDPRRLDHPALAADLLRRKPVLRDKLVAACDVDEAGAHAALMEVLRFLSLVASGPGTLTPSPRVDDAWHELLLCTRLYMEVCDECFGRYVHHDPGGTVEDNRRQFAETIRRYCLAFGDPDPAFWGPRAPLAPSADCGACEAAPG